MEEVKKQFFYNLFIQNGYVMDFSTADFDSFTKASIGVALCNKYNLSKGASLRAYCSEVPDENILQLFSDLLDYYEYSYSSSKKTNSNPKLLEKCKEIIQEETQKASMKQRRQPNKKKLSHGEIRTFVKRLRFLKELGSGATGTTNLFEDESTAKKIVIKKLEPCTGEDEKTSYLRFQNEVDLLSKTCHQNIVRMYDSYFFPDSFKGFISMEFIDGAPIGHVNPKNMNKTWEDIFIQTIEGFVHLEEHDITHRDIREDNILITNDGVVKIIDFGFGKQILKDEDKTNSVVLSRITSKKPEEELIEGKYDIRTDIYYLGNLFETVIPENEMESFAFKDVIEKMKKADPCKRFKSFKEIQETITSSPDIVGMFSEKELYAYRDISESINNYISKWQTKPQFFKDDEIISNLERLVDQICLEMVIPKMHLLIRCFNSNNYSYYKKHKSAYTESIREITNSLKQSNARKRAILMMNLKTVMTCKEVEIKKNDDLPF